LESAVALPKASQIQGTPKPIQKRVAAVSRKKPKRGAGRLMRKKGTICKEKNKSKRAAGHTRGLMRKQFDKGLRKKRRRLSQSPKTPDSSEAASKFLLFADSRAPEGVTYLRERKKGLGKQGEKKRKREWRKQKSLKDPRQLDPLKMPSPLKKEGR